MASNTTLNSGSGGDVIVSKERSHDGDTAKQQGVFVSVVTGGTEGAYTWEDIGGDATNGLDVDVTRVSGTVTVDGSGVTQPVSGTVTANLGTANVTNAGTFAVQAAVDELPAAAAAADNFANPTTTNIMSMNMVWDGATWDRAPGTSADGLLVNLGTNNDVTVSGTAAVTQSGTWNITNVSGTVSLPTGASTAANQSTMITALQLIDNPIVAHDAAATGSTGVNMAGAVATNSIEGRTAVANADATRVVADLTGVLVTRNATTLQELLSTSQSVTTTTSTAATNFGAGGASIHNYITSVTVMNASATDTRVSLQDGSGGTARWVFPVPAGGGATHNFNPPLKQTTANTALYFAAADAVSTIYISINGFQAQG